MSTLSIDRDYLIQTLADLVRINSINPSLVTGGAGEAEIAAYVAQALAQLGMMVNIHEVEPRRLNVVGIRRGQGGGRALMLNAHMDTVGIESMSDPFSAEIMDERLYGRGAYDMKGSLAACLAAAKALIDADETLRGDLLIAAVCDEEYASIGTADVVQHYHPQAAIVTEPTELALCLAHKGFIWLEVETHGKAAHGSRPYLGIDANMKMGHVLRELEALQRELNRQVGHPLVGVPTLHAALLNGGTAMSVIAERCVLGIERRTIPGETVDQVTGELQQVLDGLAQSDRDFRATLRVTYVREPFEVAEDAPLVDILNRAAQATLKQPPTPSGVSFWTDAALCAAAGIETVVFGPTGAGAHAAVEWVDLNTVEQAALIYAHTALAYCR
jgi:acetylornithine deacetylase